jgi:tRNA 2-selenouridine synthase
MQATLSIANSPSPPPSPASGEGVKQQCHNHGMNPVLATTVIQQLTHYDTIIDARSEGEFAEDCVPRAVNWPSLNNEERIRIGTQYKQESAFDAKKQGAALVARNIARHIEAHVIDKPKSWRPLVYCWRGGNRSGSLATVLSKIGFKVDVIDGGYREYRRAVIAELETLPAQFTFKVVCGKTGTGKTRYLQSLHDEQVLDLEALANHRGSVLGLKPGDVQPSQKLFESRVWAALRALDPERVVYVESESKKVGAVQVPEALMTKMRESECVVLERTMQERVALLMDEYEFFVQDPQALHARLETLVALRGRETVERWKAWTSDAKDRVGFESFVRESLELHYDPTYEASMKRNFKLYRPMR